MNAEEEKVELTIKQAEMICDKYCRMPYQTGNQEQLEDICWYCPINGGMGPAEEGCPELPSAQPEPLSDAYMKAVWTWLLDYQIKAAELKGRYTPYEVLSWVTNDWRKEILDRVEEKTDG